MKTFILVFLIMYLSPTLDQKFAVEQEVKDKYSKEEFKNYVGKELYYLLLNDKIRSYKKLSLSDEPPFKLSSIFIFLNDGCLLQVEFEDFKYIKSFNPERKWDINLLYKEKVSTIKFSFDIESFLELTKKDLLSD